MSQPAYALITGASSGIGEAFARALAARGKNLILVARSREKLERLGRDLANQHGISALPLTADLSLPGAAAEVVSSLRARSLTVDLLVNNAGFGGRGEFPKLPLDRQLEMLRLNVQAVMELTHLLLPSMVERREGGIINVSSVTGFQPIPYAAVYAATKAFVTSFSMGLAEELRPYGIAVVTLAPGGTKTNFEEIGEPSRAKFPGKPQTPQEVVRQALRKLGRGGGLVVPRLSNRALVFAQRLMPRMLVPRLIAKGSRPSRQKN
jgi:short-subunit dehydrogenase